MFSFKNSHLCIQDVSDESSVLVSSAQGCEHVPPVDVVVTWVNGSDPAFIESLRLHYNRFTNSIKVELYTCYIKGIFDINIKKNLYFEYNCLWCHITCTLKCHHFYVSLFIYSLFYSPFRKLSFQSDSFAILDNILSVLLCVFLYMCLACVVFGVS